MAKKAGEFADKGRDLSTPPVKTKRINSGDTLSQIAKDSGTTVKRLMEMNPNIKNANQIRAGQSIKVPPKKTPARIMKERNPYKGMTSEEIKTGTMRKSGSSTTAKKPAAKPAPKRGQMKRAESTADSPIAAKAGGMMKKMARGGKMPMIEKDGKKVPAFAADGKGKMARGGKVPAKMMRGGKTEKMMRGGKTDKMMGGGTVRGAGAAVKGKKFTRSM